MSFEPEASESNIYAQYERQNLGGGSGYQQSYESEPHVIQERQTSSGYRGQQQNHQRHEAESYKRPERGAGGGGSTSLGNYGYGYAVSEDTEGVDFNQREQSDGNKVSSALKYDSISTPWTLDIILKSVKKDDILYLVFR